MVLGNDLLARTNDGAVVFFYLILDLYDCNIVCWALRDIDHADYAVHLARLTALAEGIVTIVNRAVPYGAIAKSSRP